MRGQDARRQKKSAAALRKRRADESPEVKAARLAKRRAALADQAARRQRRRAEVRARNARRASIALPTPLEGLLFVGRLVAALAGVRFAVLVEEEDAPALMSDAEPRSVVIDVEEDDR